MDQKDIHDLIKLINKTEISEFKVKRKDFELLIRTNDYVKNSGATIVSSTPQIAMPSPVPTAAPPSVAAAPETAASAAAEPASSEDDSKYVTFKSPIVGTFYRKPAPDKDVFVKVDDTVSAGTVLCVIEAMKLFNEIESEVNGKIVKVLVDDGTPVEYDQPLFLIDPA